MKSYKHIVVGIDFSPCSLIALRQAVRLAKENGATIIAITANRTSPLCEISNLVVPYQAEETLLETGSISVKIAQFFIMDLIYTQIVKEKPEMAVENKKRTTQAVNLLQR